MPKYERAASRTAVLVCQGRAAADGRLAPGRFSDRVATELLRPEERAVVVRVRAGKPLQGWAARLAYERVRACAEVVVPRTVAIDDALRAHSNPQLVVLGAGLDTRAWRLAELASVAVWELDHPASQQDKRDRVGAREPIARSLRFVAVDFSRDRLGDALEPMGHAADVPTTWLWEGVVPYLRKDEVVVTLRAVAERSAPGSALVVSYQSPSLRARAGRVLVRVMSALGGRSAATANEPWRTLLTPRELAPLLVEAGFEVEYDEDLLAIAERLAFGPRGRMSLRTGRVALALRPRGSAPGRRRS